MVKKLSFVLWICVFLLGAAGCDDPGCPEGGTLIFQSEVSEPVVLSLGEDEVVLFTRDLNDGLPVSEKLPAGTYNVHATGTQTGRVLLDEAVRLSCKAEIRVPITEPQSTLTVQALGGGTVSSVPAGIQGCQDKCFARFPAISTVQLSAAPAPGYFFVGWEGACAGMQPECSVPMERDQNVVAKFVSGRTLSIYFMGSGQGLVHAARAPIHCTTNLSDPDRVCSAAYPAGSVVGLTATAAPGSSFERWVSGGCSGAGTSPNCAVTIDPYQPTTVFAVFKSDLGWNLRVALGGEGAAGGVVRSVPADHIDCTAEGPKCTAEVNYGNEVRLYAEPQLRANPPVEFVGWGGDCAGAGTRKYCDLTMTEPKDVTATFMIARRMLNVSVGGVGTGYVLSTSSAAAIDCGNGATQCSSEVIAGSRVTLRAFPVSPSLFSSWVNCPQPVGTTCTIPTMLNDIAVTARFDEDFGGTQVGVTPRSR